jgi:hypothetical protein
MDHEGEANACCFILFNSVAEAASAHAALNGREIPSKGITLRCEFAKSDLGHKSTAVQSVQSLHPSYDFFNKGLAASGAGCTVFVSGLGPHITTEDMTLICSGLSGFNRLKIDHEGQGNACCFVLFHSHFDANNALHQLSGYEYPGKSAAFRTEFAKSDLGSKQENITPAVPFYGGCPPFAFSGLGSGLRSSNLQMELPTTTASSTLFISGLGPAVTSAEIQNLCSSLSGFERLKVDHEGFPNACCFMLFSSPSDAMVACGRLQGCEIKSKGAQLRVEFAKQDLGRKKAFMAFPSEMHY